MASGLSYCEYLNLKALEGLTVSLEVENFHKELVQESSGLKGKKILMVNSTLVGGGVATLMKDLLPLMNSLGLNVEWLVLKAPDSFFEISKSFHNILQSEKVDKVKKKIELYKNFYKKEFEHYNQHILNSIKERNYDFIVIHDPQPLKIIDYKHLSPKSKWVWRCHIDLSQPDKTLWAFVKKYLSKYDRVIVSNKDFQKEEGYVIIPPSINPNSEINKELGKKKVQKILKKHGIPTDLPIITQVSRFDKWKDPIGVLKAYNKVRKLGIKCRLVMKAEAASDDPEGVMIKKEFKKELDKSPYKKDVIINNSIDKLIVNALQRASTIVLQKSIKEGFALTVSEALWKGTPVIGGKAGGIPLQIKHGINGFLVDPAKYEEHIEKTAGYIKYLIENPEKAKEMGQKGKEHVSKNFLTKHHVLNYLKLFNSFKSQV